MATEVTQAEIEINEYLPRHSYGILEPLVGHQKFKENGCKKRIG